MQILARVAACPAGCVLSSSADMLALMQHARVAACCCSTHAWLHARAQHCSGQLQSATAMEQPGPANDSCNPGPRSTAVHAGPAFDGCTPRLRWMPAPRARDGCLHPAPAIDEASARHGRPQPGPAMDSCNPGPRFTAHPGPAIDGCTPRLRWMAARRARDRRIQRLPRARCAWAEQHLHGLNSRGMQLLLQLHARAQLFRTQPAVLSRDLCPCTACTNGCRSAHDHRAKKCELCWCRICMGGTGGADSSWHAGTLRQNPWRICMDSAGSRCRVELLAAFCLLDFCLLPPWGTDTLPPLSFLPPQYVVRFRLSQGPSSLPSPLLLLPSHCRPTAL